MNKQSVDVKKLLRITVLIGYQKKDVYVAAESIQQALEILQAKSKTTKELKGLKGIHNIAVIGNLYQ